MGAAASIDQSLVTRVADLFIAIDANKNGSLSINEIVEFLKSSNMSETAAAAQAVRWFNTLNTNKDAMVTLIIFLQEI